MNIDIRDIDHEFEMDLRELMDKNSIATATKAVRFAVTNYGRKEKEIESLKQKLYKQEAEMKALRSFKNTCLEFADFFKKSVKSNSRE